MQIDNQIAPQTQGCDDKTAEKQARPESNGGEDSEFQLTVKKLEFSVRPRGVLAE